MSGIAGIVGRNVSSGKVTRMLHALHRRASEGAEIWEDIRHGIVLGQARRLIRDVSAKGHPPMTLNVGKGTPSLCMVFDGSIFNGKELRHELESKGVVFETQSDMEIILWGWHFWGKATPQRLRGMFAFALWDAEAKSLTFVRDRLGIQPLLWWRNRDEVVFGSSLQAMLASGDICRVLNKEGLFDYLLQGAVLQPRTMIQDVQALRPGTIRTFRVTEAGLKDEEEHYWQLKQDIDLARQLAPLPYLEQVQYVRAEIEEACKCHLEADVPMGSFLSGGVDSTGLTALMTHLSSKKIKSFSIGFFAETGMRDELSEARRAAQHIGTDHTEVVLSGKEVSEQFEHFIEMLDQPSGDGLNTYWVSKVASEAGVNVAFSGLGADELFAGYNAFGWFTEYALQEKPVLLDYLAHFLYKQWPYARMPNRSSRKLMCVEDIFITLRRYMSERVLTSTLNAPVRTSFTPRYLQRYMAQLNVSQTDSAFLRFAEYECKNYLLNVLLRDTAALSSGHELEVRSVFLDHHVVQTAFALPEESKWREGNAKAILKDAFKDLLPLHFFERKKTGFVLPINHWMERELNDKLCEVLRHPVAHHIFNQKFIRQLSRSSSAQIKRMKYLVLVLLAWMLAGKIESA